jgi:hypothetical protein
MLYLCMTCREGSRVSVVFELCLRTTCEEADRVYVGLASLCLHTTCWEGSRAHAGLGAPDWVAALAPTYCSLGMMTASEAEPDRIGAAAAAAERVLVGATHGYQGRSRSDPAHPGNPHPPDQCNTGILLPRTRAGDIEKGNRDLPNIRHL